ncbi:MAG: DUF3883 domain-containing protein [Gammaproteobacteria bacterium]|nr:DUF3883 domain-containing protein [Gammaproteobacteria bacterium]MYF59906.1 DUF3883 domain-containing protein [Gammaproteobacteria bacterium]
MNKAGTPWNTDEIEIIVEDYLDMLHMEMQAQHFNKTERNEILQERLGRSKGSIEYKHQNISAVMTLLGLPFVWGYKPRFNYQTRLCEVIEDKLKHDNLADHLAGHVNEPSIPELGITFQQPPPESPNHRISSGIIRRILRISDPATRDFRARVLGEAGEKFLYHAERSRLQSGGRNDLAEKVRWVSKEDGDGAGFDILSFSESGEERWLEAKTTNGPLTTPFWISENELRVSEKRQDVFRLVRIYDFSRTPSAYQLKPPLTDHVHLSPTNYFATLR